MLGKCVHDSEVQTATFSLALCTVALHIVLVARLILLDRI